MHPININNRQDIIIKGTTSKRTTGELKSNLGDLVRSTVLLRCVERQDDISWLSDSTGKELLKWFIPEDHIITFEELEHHPGKIIARTIYNIDDAIENPSVLDKIDGQWRGCIWKKESGGWLLDNPLLESLQPYRDHRGDHFWQQVLVESMGFEWHQQDYAFPIKDLGGPSSNRVRYDVGLNVHVHPDWTSKQWPPEHWDVLEKRLRTTYTVSRQEGNDNLAHYVQWLASCRIIITCDTLGLHLASALRKNVVAIVGPTDSREFSYNRVVFITPRQRNCMPCHEPRCQSGENCLSEIKVLDVINVIRQMMSR